MQMARSQCDMPLVYLFIYSLERTIGSGLWIFWKIDRRTLSLGPNSIFHISRPPQFIPGSWDMFQSKNNMPNATPTGHPTTKILLKTFLNIFSN
jgi:hypothetical protein